VTLQNFLAELSHQEVQLWADGERLRCKAPPGVLTTALRSQLLARKNEILAFLRSAQTTAAQPRAIIPLQPLGSRIPVFAVAGHNGDVFAYRTLARYLGRDQPFFGLEPPGLDGETEPLQSVEELAAYFAAQIQAFLPEGPCIIAGYCAGGTIAFELARQLRQRGANVQFLALIAAPYPTYCLFSTRLSQSIARQAERFGKHLRALARLSFAERRRYIGEGLARYKKRRAIENASVEDPVLLRRASVARITAAAVSRHAPQNYDGRVCLILPNHGWTRSRAEPLRWCNMAPHAEQYFGPDHCDPELLLLDPDAPAIARLFQQCRESIGETAREANDAAAIPIPQQPRRAESSGLRITKESMTS
jgi:thioesterase domain-containing protein